jgi:hydrogenase nickel incorporation protein HypB
MEELEIEKNVLDENDDMADKNRKLFSEKGVFVLNIIGSPGAGKTTLLENVIPSISGKLRTAVIEGDLYTDNDSKRIAATGAEVVQIDTEGGCHLDSEMISNKLKELDLDKTDILIIENVGNLICPAEFDLGETKRMVIISLTEGDDKPEKYPLAFLKADMVALTKTDLAPYVRADAEKMKKQMKNIHPDLKIFDCALSNDIYSDGGLAEYIISCVREKRK